MNEHLSRISHVRSASYTTGSMKTQVEAELLEGAKAFNMKTLATIYDRYGPGLYSYAMRLLGDPCLAEDCVSETFSRFLKGLRAGTGPSEYLQAYLYRVAHNWITDVYRRQPSPYLEMEEDLRAEEESQPEAQVDQHLAQDALRSALRLLTPDQRQVILLRFIEDWENDEVAAAVQKPVGTVKALQHRALEALRRWMFRCEKEDDYAFDRRN